MKTAPDQARIHVVTAFLTREGKVLVLKRSSRVGTYQGYLAGVSGYLETTEPVEQAHIELREELGLEGAAIQLEAIGDPIDVSDEQTQRFWTVHPFRFSLAKDAIPRLDWEHVEMRWVLPDDLQHLQTVPGLWQAWCRVSPEMAAGASS
ncbi:MAG: NUDIX domain-containing protein [Myxococcota bacterium]|nr:NUDIX domain-containing protein [Myxococcota bacterium]